MVELKPLLPDIMFFECLVCTRHYAQRPGKQLTFRWLHPIGLALYYVIFDAAPAEKAAACAVAFAAQRSPDELTALVQEVRLELDEPTQQVRDILDCRASEQELRDYLHLFCRQLELLLPARQP